RAPRPALFPYTTLFRSLDAGPLRGQAEGGEAAHRAQRLADRAVAHQLPVGCGRVQVVEKRPVAFDVRPLQEADQRFGIRRIRVRDRKSTRLNSSRENLV